MLRIGKLLLLFVLGFCVSNTYAQDVSAAKVYNQGLAKLKEKNYQEGFDAMTKAIELATAEEDEKVIGLAKKNGAIAAYNLGNSFTKAKDFEKALTTYEKGIEFNAEYKANYSGKAIALKGLGKTKEAVEAFVFAGDLYEKAGKEKKANKLFKRGATMIGKLYTSDKFDEAIELGKVFLATKPNANVAYYIGRAFEKKKDFEKALEFANQVMEFAGDDVKDKFYMLKGGALEGLKKKAEAITEYKKVKAGSKYEKQAKFKINKLEGK